MTLYAFVINDRHVDTEVRLFADPERAVQELHSLAAEMEWAIDDPTPGSWLASCQNEREDDNAHVVAVEVET